MPEFDHERMDVYRGALEFVRSATAIRGRLPPGRSPLADQLDRAAVSIALNIAEAAGEFARKEKARFYRIARRSATECAAILDIVRELEMAEEMELGRAKEQLRSIVSMLIGLSKWAEDNAPPTSNERRA
jgi:four helix bundle protein